MALFVSGELISVLCFVCEFEADRIFVARDYFEVLGQNTSVFLTLFNYPSIGRKNLWYLKHLRIDL